MPDSRFDSDRYSSESESSASEGEEILGEVSLLRTEGRDRVSLNIWERVDSRIKPIVERYASKSRARKARQELNFED